jgi:DNA-directed RNA polymerase specialized sigma subunit
MPVKNDAQWHQTETLIQRGKEGDALARNKLRSLLQPFVRSIVHSQIRSREQGMFEDLVDAGNRGLLDAYERFNVARKNKFTTYAYMFVWKAIDVEKWVIRGLDEKLARDASAVLKAKYVTVIEIAEKAGVAPEKVDRIVHFLNVTFVQIERKSSDGSLYDWLSEEDVQAEIEEKTVTIDRAWEFEEEDIGFIYPMIASYLIRRWKEDDPERQKRFAAAIEGPDRCLRRRLVFTNGSRGMIDVYALEQINKYSTGAGVYDRRWVWKNYSSY